VFRSVNFNCSSSNWDLHIHVSLVPQPQNCEKQNSLMRQPWSLLIESKSLTLLILHADLGVKKGKHTIFGWVSSAESTFVVTKIRFENGCWSALKSAMAWNNEWSREVYEMEVGYDDQFSPLVYLVLLKIRTVTTFWSINRTRSKAIGIKLKTASNGLKTDL
jgi:hypothetical protein